MKSVVAVILTFGLAGTALAQDDAALAKKRDAKLAEPWVKSGGWITDYGKALGEARKTGKPILAYFTRSYEVWAGCQKFEGGALVDSRFADFAKGYVLYLNVTSNVKKDKNQDLLAKNGGKGFPYAVWLDANGNLVSGTSDWVFQDASRALGGLEATGKRAAWFLDVKKKATGGGNPEKVDLLLAEVDMDRVKLADAEKRLTNLGPLTDDQKTNVEALRVRDEIKPTVEKLVKGAGFEELCAAGKRFLEMKKGGRPAPVGDPEPEFFWRCILLDAGKEKDAVAFEDGLKALKARFGDSAGSSLYFHVGTETWKSYLEQQDQVLEQLKAAAKPAGGK